MRPFFLASVLAVATTAAQAADQARSVAPFNAVSNSGPVSVTIEVGKAQSVNATGSPEFLDALVTEVSGTELRIRLKDEHMSRLKGEARVVITVPQLTRYDMSGAGETTIAHASGDVLDVRMSGAGSLRANGEVKRLKLALSGVGSVDARNLRADDVEARVSGVGSVQLYAASSLDASVGGVGSLTYYGDPKTVNTSGGGLGHITHGK